MATNSQKMEIVEEENPVNNLGNQILFIQQQLENQMKIAYEQSIVINSLKDQLEKQTQTPESKPNSAPAPSNSQSPC